MPIRTLAFAFHLSYLSGYSYSILCKDHIKAVAAKTCNEDDDKNRYFLVLTTLTSSLVWLSISTLRKSGPPTSVSLSSSARRAASVLSRVRLFHPQNGGSYIPTKTAPSGAISVRTQVCGSGLLHSKLEELLLSWWYVAPAGASMRVVTRNHI